MIEQIPEQALIAPPAFVCRITEQAVLDCGCALMIARTLGCDCAQCGGLVPVACSWDHRRIVLRAIDLASWWRDSGCDLAEVAESALDTAESDS